MSKFSVYGIYLLFSLLALMVVRYFFAIDGLYGQDAYEYLRFSTAISAGWESGHWPSGFFWPIIYPLLGAIATFVTSNTGFSLQLISVLSLAGTLIYLHRILYSITRNERAIQLYLLIGVFLSPLVFRSSLLCMSDMLCTFFVIAHVYHAIQFRSIRTVRVLFFAALLGVLAVFTRYAAAPIVVVTSLWVAIEVFKSFRISYLLFVAVAILLAMSPHLMYTHGNILHFAKHPWLSDWSILNLFRSDFVTNDGHAAYTHVNIIFYVLEILHPRFFILFIPLVFVSIRNRTKQRYSIILVAVLVYFIFLTGIPAQNTRFVLLLVPLISILCFPAFVLMYERISHKAIVLSGVAGVGLVLVFLGFQSVHERVQLEKTILTDLSIDYPSHTVYSFDLDVALRGRMYEGEVKCLYDSVYTDFNTGDLILFNATRFGEQWRGRAPMLNWKFLLSNYTLDTVKYYDQGWRLYEIR